MKNSRKEFILTEAVLAVLIILVAFAMFREKNSVQRDKISVIVQGSDSSRWSAFKYGIRMAAADQGIEAFVVSTQEHLTAAEEAQLMEEQIAGGADALIVQPASGDDTEEMLRKIKNKVPLILVGGLAQTSSKGQAAPVVEPDNYAMGETLAKELLYDYSGNLKGKTIGIVSEAADSQASADRERGFRDALEKQGAQILWSVAGFGSQMGKNFFASRDKVDFVAALDNSSLICAGEMAAFNNLYGALVYGIGCSTEAVYYLDSGHVECLVVPDEFNVGYQSLVEAAKKLKQFFFYEMENRCVSHTVLRRDTLFSKENQEIIYTMNQ